jgi:hypothetical protein
VDTRRIEAFSDGVFAIAATLLVLDLRLPGPGAAGHSVTYQLLHAWPQYFAYAVSFLTIGIMWMNHHTALAHVRRVDRPLLVLNLLLLMGVVAIPFPTALVAEHLHDSGAAQTARPAGPMLAGGGRAIVAPAQHPHAVSRACAGVVWLLRRGVRGLVARLIGRGLVVVLGPAGRQVWAG